MSHPTIPEWTDYVRAVAEDGDRAAMQGHLDSGCTSCRAVVAALERVGTLAEIDGAVTPPAGAMRSVKAFFATQNPDSHGFFRALSLRNTFDSALAPAPMASRTSGGDDSRQLIFESDEYTVELSVDRTPGEVDAVLRGQILEAHGEPLSHTPVFLVGDNEVIDRAISEPQGTFELSGPIAAPCELWVFPDDDNRIRLSLASQG